MCKLAQVFWLIGKLALTEVLYEKEEEKKKMMKSDILSDSCIL